MNKTQQEHQFSLATWASRFQEQKDSGLTVKAWCEQNNISIHTYHYWKHLVKQEYLEAVLPPSLPEIVPIAPPSLPSFMNTLNPDNSNDVNTEKAETTGQLSLFDFESETIFNEPELLSDESKEPEITEIAVSGHTHRKHTTREANLEGLPARVFEHRLSDEELDTLFPEGYKEVKVETYKRLSIIPQTFLVDEHHVHVYASKKNDGRIIRAERPADLFRGSVATASLVAAIIHSKYSNYVPLERQSKVYQDGGVVLHTNTMDNWMMNAADQYLTCIYDELHKDLMKSLVIHADETPFQVIRDDRSPGTNSYMWVYRNGKCDSHHPVVLYDYQKTRKADHPKEFLKDFSGIAVTDGYQIYHSLEKQKENFKVSGCWIHARRKFAEIVKAKNPQTMEGTIAAEAVAIMHRDNQLDDLSKTERQKQRKLVVKPLVNDYFAWIKEVLPSLPAECATAKAINYSIDQEKFLRVFLTNGNVPMDNNLAEQAIRPFTLGRKNWVNMNSVRGAQASAILYSLIETAKANRLRIYDYLELLLTELPKHTNDTNPDFLADLMPWSDYVQGKCHSLKKSK